MPRLARLDAPGILHHVIGRGIERKKIFFNDTDRSDFIDRLAELVEEGAMIMIFRILVKVVTVAEIITGSRRRVVVEARGSILWIAVRELGYSGADVGRFLGVTNSCVTRFVATGAKPDDDELIRNL
jgi:hypothetical protein